MSGIQPLFESTMKMRQNEIAKFRQKKQNGWSQNAKHWEQYIDADKDRGRLFSKVISACTGELGKHKIKSLADFGCGEGLFLRVAVSGGFKSLQRAVGIDYCAEQIASARKRTPSEKVQLIQNDFESPLPDIGGTFDVVSAQMSFIECVDLSVPFENVSSVLGINGIFALSVLEPVDEVMRYLSNGTTATHVEKVDNTSCWVVAKRFVAGASESPAEYLRIVRPIEEYVAAAEAAGLFCTKQTSWKRNSKSATYKILCFKKRNGVANLGS